MRKRQRFVIVAIGAVVMALVVGAGFALAEDQAQSQGQTQGRAAGDGFRGRGPLGRHMLAGEVVMVEDNTITVKTLKGGEEKSVKVDDKTRYRKDGNDASLADVTTGEKIGIVVGKKPEEGQDPTAKAVLIGKPDKNGAPGRPGGRLGGKPVLGTLSAINGDTLTIKTADGDKQVKLPAMNPGMRIAVVTGADGSVQGIMYNPPERPQDEPAPNQ